jgi:SAM-dependent methyltransferase
MKKPNVLQFNREAWDRQVERGNPWTIPVGPEQVAAARNGQWSVVLTPTIPVPREWFGNLEGAAVLGLAAAGGQQGPILAAAGARVTILDNSPAQLERDRMVAEREGLDLSLVQGDMADLSMFEDQSFDLIFHPVSNIFVPDVLPVWREAARVLRPGGTLLAGFCNPVMFLFDEEQYEQGKLVVRHSIPYSDLEALRPEELEARRTARDEPLSFGHSLEDQVGGQLQAGFMLTGFFEDGWGSDEKDPLTRYLPPFIATRAERIGDRRNHVCR